MAPVKKATPSWSPAVTGTSVRRPELRIVQEGGNPLQNRVRPELRTVPGDANPLHNHVTPSRRPKQQQQEHGVPAKAAGSVMPEMRTVPGGANPLHNHGRSSRRAK